MKICKYFLLSLLLCISSLSHATSFQPNGDIVSVGKVVHWESDGVLIFEVLGGASSGTFCYIPTAERSMISLVLLMKVTGMKASIHCYQTKQAFTLTDAGKVHRLILQ